MARPRLPQAKAEVSGAALIHAGRFKGRTTPKGTRSIGEPYVSMTEGQKAAWAEMVGEMPWLNSSHRQLLRVACVIAARLNDEGVGINQLQTLSAVLSKLGATPVDETRVCAPGADEADPTDRFFAPRPH